ncbi:hypothetical protein ACFFIX_20430 [Metabacillus herbersteinensis]|uniref:JAB domain-containing protein n=1 Tax=Metabacillus herbersteinensis TaxID=283816 RepID=A0ABV6GJ78_9BACI
MTKNLEQTNMFSLFGIEDEYEVEKKRQEDERMKAQAEMAKKFEEHKSKTPSATATSSSSPAAKVDKFEVNTQTTIYFYTEVIAITEYFSTEELENGIGKPNKEGVIEYKEVDENELKKRLKKDYPVIDTGAQLVYLKKKNVVSIILQGKKKGLSEEHCTKESPTSGGSFSSRKIPFTLLREFIAVSKYFSDRYGTEFYADVYFDKEMKEFFMDIPRQTASRYLVSVTEDPMVTALKVMERPCIKVMEIHSHHVMSPSPSSIDDENERDAMPLIYAIIGRINNFFPEITVRTYDMKTHSHVSLSPWSIFENPFITFSDLHDLSVVEVTEHE